MAKEEALDALVARRDKALTDFGADMAGLHLDLQAKRLDMANLSIQEEPYRRALEDYEAYATITAPAGGELMALHVQKGARVQEDALLAEIGVGIGFTLECFISLDNNFVLPGDACELSNSARVLKGTVARVAPTPQGKAVTISLASEDVVAGESFNVLFEKRSATSWTLVPNGALNQDNTGYFVYQVRRRDGMLGKEFYLERADVYIGDNDSRSTAVIRGITFLEPIMLTSSKPVRAGSIVKLMNVGDFFAD
jgi:hypothetical protein